MVNPPGSLTRRNQDADMETETIERIEVISMAVGLQIFLELRRPRLEGQLSQRPKKPALMF